MHDIRATTLSMAPKIVHMDGFRLVFYSTRSPCLIWTIRYKPYAVPKRFDHSGLRGGKSHVCVEAVVLLAGLRQICRWLPSDKVAVSFVRKPSSDDREGVTARVAHTDGRERSRRVEACDENCNDSRGLCSAVSGMGERLHAGQSRRTIISQWFHEHRTTIRDNCPKLRYGHFQAMKTPIRNVSIDNLNSAGLQACGPPRRTSSFEMSESSHSDLITSPHRASGVGASSCP